jgi:hypothetical protein
VSVVIGMPAHRTIVVPTVISLGNTMQACHTLGIPLELVIPSGSSVVMTARNQVVHTFLKTTATHLFWIDSDMAWSVEQFLRVLAMATKFDTARAVYPRRQEKIMFDREGLGFCCVKRRVIERLAVNAPSIYFGENEPCQAVFRESFVKSEIAKLANVDYEYYAEDSTFFVDVEGHGFTSWIDPKSNVGHVGEKTYRGNLEDLWEVADDGVADRLRAQSHQASDEAGA